MPKPCAFLPLRARSVTVAIDTDNWRQTGPCPGLAKASSSGPFSAWGCCAPRCWSADRCPCRSPPYRPSASVPRGWDVHNDNQGQEVQGVEDEEEGR